MKKIFLLLGTFAATSVIASAAFSVETEFVNRQASARAPKVQFAPGAVTCLGLRCRYHLLNASIFSDDNLIAVAKQSISGLETGGLDNQTLGKWIGKGSGKQSNLEVAFGANDEKQLAEIGEVLAQIDTEYNDTPLTAVSVTMMVFHLENQALLDLGISMDGYFNPNNIGANQTPSWLSTFGAAADKLTMAFGGLSMLLRLRVSALSDKGYAKQIFTATQRTWDGGGFEFKKVVPSYLFSGGVSPEKEGFGIELAGNVYMDGRNDKYFNLKNVRGYYSFLAPSVSVKDNTTLAVSAGNAAGVVRVTGPERNDITLLYDQLQDDVPRSVYSISSVKISSGSSIGTLFGKRGDDREAQILVFMTVAKIKDPEAEEESRKLLEEAVSYGNTKSRVSTPVPSQLPENQDVYTHPDPRRSGSPKLGHP